MTEKTHDGDEVPEGFVAETTTEVAIQFITGALAALQGLLSTDEMDAMFLSVEKSIEANSPETNAALMMSIATLAAGAYSHLSDLTEASPLDLLQADAALNDLIATLGSKL